MRERNPDDRLDPLFGFDNQGQTYPIDEAGDEYYPYDNRYATYTNGVYRYALSRQGHVIYPRDANRRETYIRLHGETDEIDGLNRLLDQGNSVRYAQNIHGTEIYPQIEVVYETDEGESKRTTIETYLARLGFALGFDGMEWVRYYPLGVEGNEYYFRPTDFEYAFEPADFPLSKEGLYLVPLTATQEEVEGFTDVLKHFPTNKERTLVTVIPNIRYLLTSWPSDRIARSLRPEGNISTLPSVYKNNNNRSSNRPKNRIVWKGTTQSVTWEWIILRLMGGVIMLLLLLGLRFATRTIKSNQ